MPLLNKIQDDVHEHLTLLQTTLQLKDGVFIKESKARYSMHELQIPFVNLSIPSKNKVELGEKGLIDICLNVLQLDDNEPNYYIRSNLDRAKQDSAKVH